MTKHERAIEAAIAAGHEAWGKKNTTEADAWKAGIAAYLAVMREPGPNEVRVRAAVAVNATDDGEPRWVIAGRYDESDNEVANWIAGDTSGEQERDQFHWLEGNVPAWKPPAEETVEGEVTG